MRTELDAKAEERLRYAEGEFPEKEFAGQSPDTERRAAFEPSAPTLESLEEGRTSPLFGDKLAGFATKAAKIAGGAVVAPVALAAMGASAAYEALTKDDEQKHEDLYKEHEQQAERESPKPKPLGTEEISADMFPAVPETDLTKSAYEEKPKPEEGIKDHVSPITEHESPKAAESPISTVSRIGEEPMRTELDAKAEERLRYAEGEFPEKEFAGQSPDTERRAAFEPSAPTLESLEEGRTSPLFGDKLAGFATKAAKIAGGAVVAPVALAAMGASAAYEALTKDDEQKHEDLYKEHEQQAERESPKPKPLGTEEISADMFPAVPETDLTKSAYEEKPKPEEGIKDHVSPITEHESPKAAESPISTVSRIGEEPMRTELDAKAEERLRYAEGVFPEKEFAGQSPDTERRAAFEPSAPTLESPEEGRTSPSFGDKLAGFATKAAKIAGGAVVAPVALAAMGASAAYEALTKEDEQKHEDLPWEHEQHAERESQKPSPVGVEKISDDMFPTVPESDLAIAAYEEKTVTEEIKDRVSPTMEHATKAKSESPKTKLESIKPAESSVSMVSREEACGENLSVTEPEKKVPLFEQEGKSLPFPTSKIAAVADIDDKSHLKSVSGAYDVDLEQEICKDKGKGAQPHVIESKDYDIEEDGKPLSSPKKVERSPSFTGEPGTPGESVLTAPDIYRNLEDDYQKLPQGKSEEAEQHVIESEEFIKDEERSLSSPTKMEEPSSVMVPQFEGHKEDLTTTRDSQITLTGEHGVYAPQDGEDDSHVIESEDFVKQKERSLSPTKVGLPDLYSPESQIEDMATTTDSQLGLTGEHGVYAPQRMDSHVIESEDFVEQKERSLSPTRVGLLSVTGIQHPESHVEDITTTRDSSLTLTGNHAVYAPQAGESEPHVIVLEKEMPLSSPTRTKPQGSEIDEQTKMKEPPSKLDGSDRLTHVVDSADYDLVQEERHFSSDIATDAEHPDHHSPTQPSLHVLQEEALGNVFKMRFSDTAELESPEQQSAHTPSSYPDEQHSIAGDDEWKVYDSKGEIVEEFSSQLTEELIQEAETNASVRSEQSPRKIVKQESSEVTMEPEIDYHSDLQEKLDILAEERRDKLFSVQEEEDHLEVIDETDYEQEAHQDHEIEQAALRLVDEAITAAMEAHEEAKTHTSTSGSNVYQTATEHSKDEQYDTCVTSQDTYDSAQEWASQESEYTTAASGATSRLSEAEERQGSVTPLAILSPVDSDRHFTANQDFEEAVPVIRHFMMDDTARSTPDVPLQVTIEEEEEESEATLPTSPSGVLLPPRVDPGRPVSPVPPTRQTDDDDEEDYFVFVERPQDKVFSKSGAERLPERRSAEVESTSDSHEKSYSRQLSDISSGSYADTVIHHGKGDVESVADVEDISTYEHAGSPGLAEKESLKSSPEEKKDTASQKSEVSPMKVGEESDEQPEKDQTMESPSSESSARERTSDNEEGFVICSPIDDAPMEGELETVEEEPEDVESINGSGNSSVGVPSDTLALVGKYKHVSSDNVSLTSLQEFERLEQMVLNHGEGSLSASEIELYAAGKLRCTGSNGSGEGSVSSLAEFEKLEQELTANISPQEEVAMLPEIREESEVEDMSVRDDDEEEHSETEVKTRPIDEEDLRSATPIASPVDSLEHEPIVSTIPLLETSTDSLEPSYERVEAHPQRDSEVSSLAEYEVITRLDDSVRDSLENIPHERDSLLEGASQDMTSQDTRAMLSGDTVETYQEHDDDDKDSLGGEMDTMLRDYPTTLTTFETTAIAPDGTVQTISRRVETRVRDPIMSHVTFTGTESEERATLRAPFAEGNHHRNIRFPPLTLVSQS
ncbi:unnamed protein product [Cylicocyclus nassatus]|uniref:Uncharacterized protein n=1 Tax=Cylicocyclus nassatus TaxID=53992 RepID=A0AA36MB79_CYLNA|nr:unnamed protein product [Cylicocyclus nassatus]